MVRNKGLKMDTLVQETTKRLHAQGGRMTSQRRLILETLTETGGHPTAEELFNIVNQCDPNIHLSTVYRTLRWLEQEGLVSARHFDEEQRQDRFDPALPIEHDHFVCKACQQVIEFNHPAKETIRKAFEHQNGALVESISIELYGLCAECQSGKSDSTVKLENI
jgi:Fe2+ or Zn2+ uptake regulation protein